ncbi:MAG: Glycerophosphodiester phosphodiesterase [Humibacillus sp.]|nr:Glycerophosphodiester phosphodiesterase [Humibacillus sp.]
MAARRPYLDRTPVALAHRGGALYGPNVGLENTMTAFTNAVSLGYTHLETDVHLTRDGRLVAFHDSRLDRVSDRVGRLRDLSWSEVSEARLGGGPGHAGAAGTERPPLLEEVVDAFDDVCFNVDLKAPGTARALWRLIEERGLHDRLCVGSFHQRHLSQFRSLSRGRVATASGVAGTALLRLSPSWLTALLRTPADVLQVPGFVPFRGRRIMLVTEGFVADAHQHDKQVHVWTVDDPAEMHRLLDLGVDGLVSDRIDVLKEVLLARGSWTGTP